MWRIIKALVFLTIIGFIALAGFAYLGDLTPERQQKSEPVMLDVQ